MEIEIDKQLLCGRVGHAAVKTVLKHHSDALDDAGIGLDSQDGDHSAIFESPL